MRDLWYGDHRDVVKWASLVYLARAHGTRRILQVAFCRSDKLEEHHLVVNGREKARVADEVWRHFRNLHQIQGLARACSLEIDVFDHEFAPPRELYIEAVCGHISASPRGPMVVFLDPDTGLAPESGADLKHLTAAELRTIYTALRSDDVIVFYQHARRHSGWLEEAQREFCRATDTDRDTGLTITCPSVAKDVALFVSTKGQ